MFFKKFMLYPIILGIVLTLNGCASTPKNIGNACSVLEQKNGWIFNWRRSTRAASRRYDIPVPLILATIYAESGFQARAKPPRRKLLGFIPWTRMSSSYGYSQAINGTWKHYSQEAGGLFPIRNSFSDSANFIAWYYDKIARQQNISRNDAYHLYIAYHMGANSARSNNIPASVRASAQRVANMTALYQQQLTGCGML